MLKPSDRAAGQSRLRLSNVGMTTSSFQELRVQRNAVVGHAEKSARGTRSPVRPGPRRLHGSANEKENRTRADAVADYACTLAWVRSFAQHTLSSFLRKDSRAASQRRA